MRGHTDRIAQLQAKREQFADDSAKVAEIDAKIAKAQDKQAQAEAKAEGRAVTPKPAKAKREEARQNKGTRSRRKA